MSVRSSRALSGYLRAIGPSSEAWRFCTVPERAEVVTRMMEAWPALPLQRERELIAILSVDVERTTGKRLG